MNIELICMDLDGTALTKDRCSFSPRLLEALDQAHRQGVKIAPVTGRQFGLLPPVLREDWPWKQYGALCNGGQIRSLATGQVLSRWDIPRKTLEQLRALAEKWQVPMEISWDSTLYLTEKDYAAQQNRPELAFHRDVILANHGKLLQSLGDYPENVGEKVNLLCISPEKAQGLWKDLEAIPVSGVWASSTSLEITHPQATKANAMHQLCRLLDVPVSRTLALGDSGNDESMLRQAGLGIAMGNAPKWVQALADGVTAPYDQDGAALAIETYVLHT